MNFIVEARRVSALIRGEHAPELLRDERLHEIVAATASRTPGAPAIRHGGETMSFAALDQLSARWASGLSALGAGPDRVVGIYCARGPALLTMILAILKTGAAYLPFDAQAPQDRVAGCLEDAGAVLLVTDDAHAGLAAAAGCRQVTISAVGLAAESAGTSTMPRPDAEAAAYIIYTSGSTGKPKGVAISHRNICHLLRAENTVLRLAESDIVYHGFSVAFDMSLEEIFISWMAGACVYAASDDEVRNFDRLPALLTARSVTVLHCVPSMLAMIDAPMPTLRLINVGGEACPDALVDRWWRWDCRMLNTYGPTETTVTATAAELHPGRKVTIGRLLPNYTGLICDEHGRPVPEGELGELYIGGPGVGMGYINRAELTAAKFLPVEHVSGPHGGAVFYRTGDAARLNERGELELAGRLDSQVKHRGFRIELGEIEAALCALPGIRAAVAMLRGEGAAEHLAAVVVPEGPFDEPALRAAVRGTLPCYMIPAIIAARRELPRLQSGKIDRQSCKKIDILAPAEVLPDDSALEPCLAVLRELFGHRAAGAGQDFFDELGGHSLLAAAFVTSLRKLPRFAGISLQDVYELRTAAKICARFPAGGGDDEAPGPAEDAGLARRYRWCALAQALGMIPVFGLAALEFLVPYALFEACAARGGFGAGALAAWAGFVVVPVVVAAAAVAAKRLLVGRMRPGRHRLWGGYFFRWWLAQRLLALVDTGLFAETSLMACYFRALGATIGQGVHLGAVEMNAPDLVTIGAGASLGEGVLLHGARIDDGWLVVGPVHVGAKAHIGTGCVLEAGSAAGEGAELASLSLLNPNAAVPAGEAWAGSPACHRGAAAAVAAKGVTRARRSLAALGFALAGLLVVPVMALLPMLPGLYVMHICPHDGAKILAAAPVVGGVYVMLMMAQAVLVRRLFLGRAQAGDYSVFSLFYLRKWFVDRVMGLSLTALHPLYASLFMPAFFRALGARVGRGAEISTASGVTHGLLEIGEGAFVADGVVLGDSEIRAGRLTLRQTVLGCRAFIGNGAVLPDGVRIDDGALVGCLSVPPEAGLRAGESCMGSPAMILPRRQGSARFAARLIDRPGRGQVAARAGIELFRILLPRAAMFVMIVAGLAAFHAARASLGGFAFAALPVIYTGVFAAPAVALCAALKWLMVGSYEPAEYPLWSTRVWLSEAVTAIYEALAVPLVLRHVRGTALLPVCLKWFGARIGARVYLDSTDVTEFDLVTLGEGAVLDTDCGPQTHLFEDRVMKMGKVMVGARSQMGARSLALPGSSLADGARLGGLSMVMKGECIPGRGRWAGLPAVSVKP